MIVLDTHVWIWWTAEPEALSARARSAIDDAAGSTGLLVSAISVWEVAMLVAHGRLELTYDVGAWVARAQSLPYLRFVNVDPELALRSVHLPEYPRRDPADRFIVATAIALDANLVTKDRVMRAYEAVTTIW